MTLKVVPPFIEGTFGGRTENRKKYQITAKPVPKIRERGSTFVDGTDPHPMPVPQTSEKPSEPATIDDPQVADDTLKPTGIPSIPV